MSKSKTQDEANQKIGEAVEKKSPEDRKTFIHESIKVMEKEGNKNSLLLVKVLRNHFVRH